MKVAFATSDGVHLDEQFRRASRLDVYELGEQGARLHGSHTFPPDRTVKTEARLMAIAGAEIVYGTAFIPSAAARIAATGIRPATAPRGTPIAELLERLAGSQA
jgi:nitrogen fixation protein NifX